MSSTAHARLNPYSQFVYQNSRLSPEAVSPLLFPSEVLNGAHLTTLVSTALSVALSQQFPSLHHRKCQRRRCRIQKQTKYRYSTLVHSSTDMGFIALFNNVAKGVLLTKLLLDVYI